MRKYIEGERITTLDELNRQKLIYVHSKITPRGWFQSWPLRLANTYLEGGAIRYAVPRVRQRIEEDDFIEMLGG